MKLSDFDFKLPDHLIAQTPAPERDQSRMMVVWRNTGRREHHIFRELPDILGPEYFLVINTSRVFPARLRAKRPARKEHIEILLLAELNPLDNLWLALVKPAKKAPVGQKLYVADISAQVIEASEDGKRVIRFDTDDNLRKKLELIGEPPLPPYIRRQIGQDLTTDVERYQTIYARQNGSVAAPTAGLHFTHEVLQRLKGRGIPVCEILLHVGYGTFQPVRTEDITQHKMEPEFYEIDSLTAARIRNYKAEGRKLIAVGTTTTRCLEYLASKGYAFEQAESGYCHLFIYPGFKFTMLDGLLTNFHLPRSTLFMLVCAFAGRELMLDCYREAIFQNYRFYSYGDCMLIL